MVTYIVFGQGTWRYNYAEKVLQCPEQPLVCNDFNL